MVIGDGRGDAAEMDMAARLHLCSFLTREKKIYQQGT